MSLMMAALMMAFAAFQVHSVWTVSFFRPFLESILCVGLGLAVGVHRRRRKTTVMMT